MDSALLWGCTMHILTKAALGTSTLLLFWSSGRLKVSHANTTHRLHRSPGDSFISPCRQQVQTARRIFSDPHDQVTSSTRPVELHRFPARPRPVHRATTSLSPTSGARAGDGSGGFHRSTLCGVPRPTGTG